MVRTLTHDYLHLSDTERKGWLFALVVAAVLLANFVVGGPDLTSTGLMTDPNLAA